VRVRGVATDEYNRNLVRNRLQSGESVSSFEQPPGEVKHILIKYNFELRSPSGIDILIRTTKLQHWHMQ